MKKQHAAIVVVVLIAIGLLLALSFRPSRNGRNVPVAGPAEAQVHEHGATPDAAGKASTPPQKTQGPPDAGETAAEAPTIEISPEKQQLIGVKTATVAVRPLTKTIRTVGLVEYDQRRLNTITTKIEGWVEKLYINFTGSYVRKGQPVADIYSPELWATQQEFINAVKWAKSGRQAGTQRKAAAGAEGAPDIGAMIDRDAQTLVEATRQRLKLWDISDAQIQKIEESERPIRTLTIYTPYSGYVLQKNVNQGSRVTPGAALFEVADLSTVWVTADIYEFELPLIKAGDRAQVQLAYLPGRRFTATIDYIYPTLQGETRTAKARFTIPNEGGRLKPQMFTNVELTIDLGRRLAVPSDAVINTGIRQIAYVDKGDGNFEPREVATGVQAEDLTEITAGLKAGEKVASSANFLIDSEAKLKGVEPLPRQKKDAGQRSGAAPAAGTAHHQH